MDLELISYNIKFFREQHEWTQKDLAQKLSTSRSVIAKWENNAVIPDVSSLVDLSSIFNVTIDRLIGHHSLSEDLLKEFKQVYASDSRSFDAEAMEIVEYAMQHPNYKMQINRLKQLSLKKQKSLHSLFDHLIQEYEQL